MIIEARQDTKTIGFNSVLADEKKQSVGEILKQVMPQDFIKFGLIPEFIGRVPVVVTLNGLDEAALVRILKEPKNSLIRQYHKLFELDGVELEFDEAALTRMAQKSHGTQDGSQRTAIHHGRYGDGSDV